MNLLLFLHLIQYMNRKEDMGRVFWITGLSGAGKTTIGYLLYTKLKIQKNSIVFLDGD